MLACEGGRWTVMLCWTAPPTCLHLIPTPYPLLAISTNVLLSLLFFTVFGTTDDILNQWPATRRLQKFCMIKTPDKKQRKCNNNLWPFLCLAVQKATLPDMEGSCEHVEHVLNAHIKICRVRCSTSEPILFCTLHTGVEFAVEGFSPPAFEHDISTQLSIYTFTARILLWQVVIQKWFVVHYVHDCTRATDVYCNWHTAGLAATLCLHFVNIWRLF